MFTYGHLQAVLYLIPGEQHNASTTSSISVWKGRCFFLFFELLQGVMDKTVASWPQFEWELPHVCGLYQSNTGLFGQNVWGVLFCFFPLSSFSSSNIADIVFVVPACILSLKLFDKSKHSCFPSTKKSGKIDQIERGLQLLSLLW